MCCAIRKTCRSYLRTNVSYADTSPPRTLSTRATSGCCSFSPAIGWMVAMGVSCGKSSGGPGAACPVGDICSVTDGGELNQTAMKGLLHVHDFGSRRHWLGTVARPNFRLEV